MKKKRGKVVKSRKKYSSKKVGKPKKKSAKKSAKKFTKKTKKKPQKHEETFFEEVEKGIYKEFHAPKHKGRFIIPIGIKVLTGYLSFLAAIYVISLFSGISFPVTILFGKLVTGTAALIINIILVALIFVLIYGYYKRKAFAFDLSIAWFGFAALNALISLILFKAEEQPMFKGLMLLSFVTLFVINTVVVWYILKERRFFHARVFRVKRIQHQDKIFLYTVISFWVIAILIGSVWGVSFYKSTTSTIDNLMLEINFKNPKNMYTFCMEKDPEERDICLLIAANIEDIQSQDTEKQVNIIEICNDIDSDFYKFTCYRTLEVS